MPGIKKRLQTSSYRGAGIFEMKDTCEDCGCLVWPVPHRKDLYRCMGRCGYVSDPIPLGEFKKGKRK